LLIVLFIAPRDRDSPWGSVSRRDALTLSIMRDGQDSKTPEHFRRTGPGRGAGQIRLARPDRPDQIGGQVRADQATAGMGETAAAPKKTG